MKSILKTSLYMALAACALTSAPTLYAQSSTPLKIVIGFSAGGGLDNMSRALAEKLRTELDLMSALAEGEESARKGGWISLSSATKKLGV